MKKYIILAAALATMASCTKNASLEVAPVAEDEAIGFSAYSGTAATKGTVVATTEVISPATNGGIGVFAFYQPATNGVANKFNSTKFASPDFMYDTQVKPDQYTMYSREDYNTLKGTSLDEDAFEALPDAEKIKSVEKWAYSPLKFWPNNEGDLISFFAYTPYDENKTWEDLGFKTDVNATKLTASFPVYTEKTAMEDYVFATPALNKSKQNIGGAKINFDFKHIMSRVAIQIGAVDDKVSAEGPQAWTQPVDGTGTVITVESIEFQGIAESYDYTYTIETGKEAWKENGSQNLLLSAKADDFQNNTSASWIDANWKTLLKDENGKPAYLFIAPQDLTNANLVITYTVATTDKSNPANNSTIKNVITKPVNVNFLSGKAYTLNLLIGMKKVEISATVGDWDDTTATSQQIDVPATKSIIYPESGSPGIEIGGLVWAPVNCGYDATNYKYGKLYQFGRKYGSGYNDGIYTESLLQELDSSTTDVSDMTDPAKFYQNWTADEWTAENDPCPAGWRVPTANELIRYFLGIKDYDPVNYQINYDENESFDDPTSVELSIFNSTIDKVDYKFGPLLPSAGYRIGFNDQCFGRALTGRDILGYYWSSSVQDNEPITMWIYPNDVDDPNEMYAEFPKDDPASGYSVRCVKIQE